MRKMVFSVLIAASIVFPCAAQTNTEKLTKPKIQSVIDSLVASVVKKDLEGFLRHLSPDSLIVMKALSKKRRAVKRSGLVKMSKKQYRAALTKGFKSTNEFQYRVSNVNILIDPDGKGATVTDVATENVVRGGKKVEAKLFETIVFELRNGQPKIKLMYGRVGG